MENNNIYQMHNNKTIKSKECIEIQLGRQKKKKYKDTSVFFSNESFSPLGQTIWNNFREYQPNSNVKISAKEWMKIIRGLNKLSDSLQDSVYKEELIALLRFKTEDQKNLYKSDFISINKNIDSMLKSFIAWIEPELQNHDYITISG